RTGTQCLMNWHSWNKYGLRIFCPKHLTRVLFLAPIQRGFHHIFLIHVLQHPSTHTNSPNVRNLWIPTLFLISWPASNSFQPQASSLKYIDSTQAFQQQLPILPCNLFFWQAVSPKNLLESLFDGHGV